MTKESHQILSDHKGSKKYLHNYVKAKSIYHSIGDIVRFDIYPEPEHIYTGPPTRIWVLYIKIYNEVFDYDLEYRICETYEEASAIKMLHNLSEANDEREDDGIPY